MALAEIIQRNDITGREIADAIGVAPETISRWTQQHRQPRGQNVGRLLEYLSKRLRRKVRYEDLFAPARERVRR